MKKVYLEEVSLAIIFPKQLINELNTYVFFDNILNFLQKPNQTALILDMSSTEYFDTSLLAALYLMFNEKNSYSKKISVMLPNGDKIDDYKIVYAIFNFYAFDKRSFYKPRYIGQNNARETEDLLLKYLKRINLRDYDLVKIIISELIANIKMHTDTKKGYVAGHISSREKELRVSIANGEYSIAEQLKIKANMVFEDDKSAVLWSLKKTNSTRNEKESGGLGLYLLRKYIYALKGAVSILSGRCYLKFDYTCFDPLRVNIIEVNEIVECDFVFNGTIINLFIPYEVDNTIKDVQQCEDTIIDLSNRKGR